MSKTRRYQLAHSTLALTFGDITESEAQVIVSSDDYYLSMGGGVSAAILRAGGESIALDAAKKVPAQLGDVVVTSAGALPADYIFHAVTIGAGGETLPPKQLVARSVSKCLRLLEAMGLRSIAFPAIGTGVARLPLEDVAVAMAEEIARFASASESELQIGIYLHDRFGERSEIDYAIFFEEFARRVPLPNRAAAAPVFVAPEPAAVPLTPADQVMERRNHVRQILVKLERQRQKLESELIDVHIAGDENALAHIRAKLKDNELLRLNYVAESRDNETAGGPARAAAGSKVVFLSSTYKDLRDYRLKVKDEIHKLRLDYSGMEWFGADGGAAPTAKIVQWVRACDIYVGVIGVRYGSIDDATGLSMTELEYRTAVSEGKRIHMYVMDGEAQITSGMIEADPAGYAKLQQLKTRVLKDHTVFFFRSAEELARQVAADLRVYL